MELISPGTLAPVGRVVSELLIMGDNTSLRTGRQARQPKCKPSPPCAVGVGREGLQGSIKEQQSHLETVRVWPGDPWCRQDCLCLPLPRTDGWGPSVGGADESFAWKARVNKHPRLPWWAQWVPPPLLHPAGMRLEENEVMSVVGAPGLAVRVNWPGAQGTMMCPCLDPGSRYSLRSFGGHREVKKIE